MVDYGIPSKHNVVRIFLKLTLKHKKINISKIGIDWDLAIEDKVKNNFNLKLKNRLIECRYNSKNDVDFADFNKLVLYSAKEVDTY